MTTKGMCSCGRVREVRRSKKDPKNAVFWCNVCDNPDLKVPESP